jgi:hypothetical protein
LLLAGAGVVERARAVRRNAAVSVGDAVERRDLRDSVGAAPRDAGATRAGSADDIADTADTAADDDVFAAHVSATDVSTGDLSTADVSTVDVSTSHVSTNHVSTGDGAAGSRARDDGAAAAGAGSLRRA